MSFFEENNCITLTLLSLSFSVENKRKDAMKRRTQKESKNGWHSISCSDCCLSITICKKEWALLLSNLFFLMLYNKVLLNSTLTTWQLKSKIHHCFFKLSLKDHCSKQCSSFHQSHSWETINLQLNISQSYSHTPYNVWVGYIFVTVLPLVFCYNRLCFWQDWQQLYLTDFLQFNQRLHIFHSHCKST